MAFSPIGLWLAIATFALILTPVAEAAGGRKATVSSKTNHSDSFGGSNGADFSAYSGHQKLVGESSASDTQSSGLLQQSSFPVRLVVGDADPTASGKVPVAGLDPGSFQRRYKVDGCVLTIGSGFTAVTVFARSPEGDFEIKKDAIYPNSVFNLKTEQKMFVSASTEVFISVSESTKAECASRFAGRRVYLGEIGFKDVEIFTVNEKSHFDALMLDESNAKGVYLEWTDTEKPPRLESDTGYSVLIESGRYAISSAESGEFFIGMRIPWQLALKARI